jgi:hypothetical protein
MLWCWTRVIVLICIAEVQLPVEAQNWIEHPKDAYSDFKPSMTTKSISKGVNGDDDAADDDTNVELAGKHGVTVKSTTISPQSVVSASDRSGIDITNCLQAVVDQTGTAINIYLSNERPLTELIFDISFTGGDEAAGRLPSSVKYTLDGGLVAFAGLKSAVQSSALGIGVTISGVEAKKDPIFFDLSVVREKVIPAGVSRLLGSIRLKKSARSNCNSDCRKSVSVCASVAIAKDEAKKGLPFYDLSGHHGSKTTVCTPLTQNKIQSPPPSVYLSKCKRTCVLPFAMPSSKLYWAVPKLTAFEQHPENHMLDLLYAFGIRGGHVCQNAAKFAVETPGTKDSSKYMGQLRLTGSINKKEYMGVYTGKGMVVPGEKTPYYQLGEESKFIFYKPFEKRWCLSKNLGSKSCDLFGKFNASHYGLNDGEPNEDGYVATKGYWFHTYTYKGKEYEGHSHDILMSYVAAKGARPESEFAHSREAVELCNCFKKCEQHEGNDTISIQ